MIDCPLQTRNRWPPEVPSPAERKELIKLSACQRRPPVEKEEAFLT